MNCEIIGLENDIVTLKLHEPFDQKTVLDNLINNRAFAYLEPRLKDTTTDEQRKHYWALIKDISSFTGDPTWKVVLNMKYLYMIKNDKTKEPSMARNKLSKKEARELIQTIIDYALDNEIPLNNNYSQYFEDSQLFKLAMNRQCFVCGSPSSDIHHVDAVGMGRNRGKYKDHDKHLMMCLCRGHHQYLHTVGQETFEQNFHVHGICLSKENLKQLGVM